MSLFGKVAKLAKKATGSISGVRKVLDLNPSLSGLVLPPQVSMGLKVASAVGGAVGVKIPTEDEVIDYATGKIKGALGNFGKTLDKAEGVVSEVLEINGKLVKVQGAIQSASKLDKATVEEVLESIDWLIG